MAKPINLGTIDRMMPLEFIRYTPDMEPKLMDQLSPAVKLKLMELLQNESL